ncbi:uncharacterized protein LOC129585413 [Paramacrobiotus metropolitanus]|uniref:uncharacterized protein LOC129585413 n=1 Tax=Paramacrobiotus metropolitanus TaxID=2943436 RepID=UPI0024456970|nr:uncharacterized protein LOC129585413 [Paramacrobiotus metropolitanus]
MNNVMDTLYCAKNYMIDKLSRACRDYVQSHLSADYACDIFQQRFTIKYAVSGYALREVLGTIFHSIRFPLFTASQLADGPVADEVFDDKESIGLFRHICAKVKPEIPFITEPRLSIRSRIKVAFGVYATNFGNDSEFVGNVVIELRPDLAPECCRFLVEQIQSESYHIAVATGSVKMSNDHEENIILGQSVVEEQSVLSPTIPGAVWYEWSTEPDDAGNENYVDLHIVTLSRYRRSDRSCAFGRVVEGLDISTSFESFQRTMDLMLGKWYHCRTADWCVMEDSPDASSRENSDTESDSDSD